MNEMKRILYRIRKCKGGRAGDRNSLLRVECLSTIVVNRVAQLGIPKR